MRVLVLLLLLPLASANFMQIGYDAARSGDTPNEGPLLDEVAWIARLDGSRAGGPPLIVGDNIYIVTNNLEENPELTVNGVWRMSLATGFAEQIAEIPAPDRFLEEGSPETHIQTASYAANEDTLFVTAPRFLRAISLQDGATEWEWNYPIGNMASVDSVRCAEPVVTAATVYVGCNVFGQVAPPVDVGYVAPVPPWAFVAAIDLESGGQESWVRYRSAGVSTFGPDAPVATCDPTGTIGCAPASRAYPYLFSMSVIGRVVVVLDYAILEPRTGAEYVAFHGFDKTNGVSLWSMTNEGPGGGNEPPQGTENLVWSPFPTGDDDVIYLTMRNLVRLVPLSGAVIDNHPLGTQDITPAEGGSSMMLGGERLFFTSAQEFHWIDRGAWTQGQTGTFPVDRSSDEAWSGDPLIRAGDIVYGKTKSAFSAQGQAITEFITGFGQETKTHFAALDAETGLLLWKHTFEVEDSPGFVRLHDFGIDQGLMIVAGVDGYVTAIGRSEVSIQPVMEASSHYPAPYSPVKVSMAKTAPGVDGAATEFRADWGDGTVTPWQSSPEFEHAYDDSADGHAMRALFSARNEAGQVSSEVMLFQVGANAPPSQTFLENAFARDNQDLTFGVLGIAVALAGGLIAVTGSRRKSGRLRREMLAIEEAGKQARTNPGLLRKYMHERHVHCRRLLLTQKIDEAQFGTLERHIEATARGGRLGEISHLMDILPHSMVTALEEMLADGRVSSWERKAFHGLLEGNQLLSGQQKKRIGDVIDGWFSQDNKSRA